MSENAIEKVTREQASPAARFAAEAWAAMEHAVSHPVQTIKEHPGLSFVAGAAALVLASRSQALADVLAIRTSRAVPLSLSGQVGVVESRVAFDQLSSWVRMTGKTKVPVNVFGTELDTQK